MIRADWCLRTSTRALRWFMALVTFEHTSISYRNYYNYYFFVTMLSLRSILWSNLHADYKTCYVIYKNYKLDFLLHS